MKIFNDNKESCCKVYKCELIVTNVESNNHSNIIINNNNNNNNNDNQPTNQPTK